MIDSMNLLWSFLTIFFTDYVVNNTMFMALILLNLIFAVFYLVLKIFDAVQHGGKW